MLGRRPWGESDGAIGQRADGLPPGSAVLTSFTFVATRMGSCIAEAKPYALEFSNTADVICLLLGDISSSTKFEDDCEKPLIF
jgi:AraC family transcriptional regulator